MTTTITIKDLKQLAAGTEIKGLILTIKTARKSFPDAEGTFWQEVVFFDSSGEMTGHIQVESESMLWQSKTNICIMNGEIQDTDERRKETEKLVVYECFNALPNLTYDQSQELYGEDYKKLREDEIKGKIRHGLSCALLSDWPDKEKIILLPFMKNAILEWQEFILTGE